MDAHTPSGLAPEDQAVLTQLLSGDETVARSLLQQQGEAQVDTTFRKLSMKYHPDRVQDLNAKTLYNEAFQNLSRARDALYNLTHEERSSNHSSDSECDEYEDDQDDDSDDHCSPSVAARLPSTGPPLSAAIEERIADLAADFETTGIQGLPIFDFVQHTVADRWEEFCASSRPKLVCQAPGCDYSASSHGERREHTAHSHTALQFFVAEHLAGLHDVNSVWSVVDVDVPTMELGMWTLGFQLDCKNEISCHTRTWAPSSLPTSLAKRLDAIEKAEPDTKQLPSHVPAVAWTQKGLTQVKRLTGVTEYLWPKLQTEVRPMFPGAATAKACSLCSSCFDIFHSRRKCGSCAKPVCKRCCETALNLPKLGQWRPCAICRACTQLCAHQRVELWLKAPCHCPSLKAALQFLPPETAGSKDTTLADLFLAMALNTITLYGQHVNQEHLTVLYTDAARHWCDLYLAALPQLSHSKQTAGMKHLTRLLRLSNASLATWLDIIASCIAASHKPRTDLFFTLLDVFQKHISFSGTEALSEETLNRYIDERAGRGTWSESHPNLTAAELAAVILACRSAQPSATTQEALLQHAASEEQKSLFQFLNTVVAALCTVKGTLTLSPAARLIETLRDAQQQAEAQSDGQWVALQLYLLRQFVRSPDATPPMTQDSVRRLAMAFAHAGQFSCAIAAAIFALKASGLDGMSRLRVHRAQQQHHHLWNALSEILVLAKRYSLAREAAVAPSSDLERLASAERSASKIQARLLSAFTDADVDALLSDLEQTFLGLQDLKGKALASSLTTIRRAGDPMERAQLQRAFFCLCEAVYACVACEGSLITAASDIVRLTLQAALLAPTPNLVAFAGRVLGDAGIHQAARGALTRQLLSDLLCGAVSYLVWEPLAEDVRRMARLSSLVPRHLTRAERRAPAGPKRRRRHPQSSPQQQQRDATSREPSGKQLYHTAMMYLDLAPLMEGTAYLLALVKAAELLVQAAEQLFTEGAVTSQQNARCASIVVNGWLIMRELVASMTDQPPSLGINILQRYLSSLSRGSRLLEFMVSTTPRLKGPGMLHGSKSRASRCQPSSPMHPIGHLIAGSGILAARRLLAHLESFPVLSLVAERLQRDVPVQENVFLHQVTMMLCTHTLSALQTDALQNISNAGDVYPRLSVPAMPLFDGALRGWTQMAIDGEVWQEQRELVMHAKLLDYGLSQEDVCRRTISPMIPRAASGWLPPRAPNLTLPQQPGDTRFHRIDGLSLDLRHGLVRVHGEKEGILFGGSALVCTQDVHDVMGMSGTPATVFTLESLPSEPNNPYHRMAYKPDTLGNTGYLDTLAQCDWLLKMISTGVEVAAVPPYALKPAREIIENRLPRQLAKDILALVDDEERRDPSDIHRFWIENEGVDFDIDVKDGRLSVRVARDVKMVVKTRRLFLNEHGKYADAPMDTTNTRMQRLAELLTTHYDAIASGFPEFARLRELSRLLMLCHVLPRALDNGIFDAERAVRQYHTQVISIVYPAANRASLRQEILHQNGLNSDAYLHPSTRTQLERAVDKAHAQAARVDSSNLSQLSDLLQKLIPTRAEADGIARRWLRSKDIEDVVTSVKQIREASKAQCKRSIQQLFGFSWEKDHEADLKQPLTNGQGQQLQLLPATFRSLQNFRTVGGVGLGAHGKQRNNVRQVGTGQQLSARKSHSGSWQSIRAQFKQQIAANDKVPRHIRGYLATQFRQKGNWRKVKNPKGFDIDHTRNNVSNCRLQYSRDNRSRGRMASGRYEKVRTRSQPQSNGGY